MTDKDDDDRAGFEASIKMVSRLSELPHITIEMTHGSDNVKSDVHMSMEYRKPGSADDSEVVADTKVVMADAGDHYTLGGEGNIPRSQFAMVVALFIKDLEVCVAHAKYIQKGLAREDDTLTADTAEQLAELLAIYDAPKH